MNETLASERDEWLKRIGSRKVAFSNHAEEPHDFHNNTLMPILRFQTGIIIAQFRKYIKKFKPAFNAYNQNTQKNFISDVLGSDRRIKNSLIASFVSMMTIDEYEYYCQHKTNSNNEIVKLLTSTLHDHLHMLY